MRRAPSLSSIEAFLAVAECGGVKAAAAKLCLSASSVTRRVQALERHAGAPLIARNNGRATLTTAGRDLRDRLQPAMQGFRAALGVADDAPVRLRISRSLAALWLAPRLSRLPKGMALTLHADLEPAHLRDAAADLGFFFGGAALDGLPTQALLPVELSVVCAPRLADGRSAPIAPTDLSAFKRLDLAGQTGLWRRHVAAPASGIVFDGIQPMYEAAAAGLGLAHGLHPLVEPYLASGRLIELAWIGRRVAGAYALVATPAALRLRKVAALRDWLTAETELPCAA